MCFQCNNTTRVYFSHTTTTTRRLEFRHSVSLPFRRNSLTLSLYIYYYKTENYLRIIVNSSRSPSSHLQQRQQCLVHIQSSILACQTLTLSLSLSLTHLLSNIFNCTLLLYNLTRASSLSHFFSPSLFKALPSSSLLYTLHNTL